MMDRSFREMFGVFGKTTLRKFSKLKIYIEGLSKIGAELAANISILTPHLLTLQDSELIRGEDCYNTLLYSREQVGKKTRADFMRQVCHRLNSKVYVDKMNGQITEEESLKFDVIIFCDTYDFGRVIAIDKHLRSQKQNKAVVMYACQMGFYGLLITDFGPEWEMFHSGDEILRIPIAGITNTEKGVVTTAAPHNFETGEFVAIKGVKGMKYVNGDARPIKVINPSSFQIEDTRAFGTFVSGGHCQKVDLMQVLKFPNIQQQLARNHSDILLAFKAIICYYQQHSKLPGLFSQPHELQALDKARILAAKINQNFNEQFVRDVIRTSQHTFYPLVHLFAAILSLQCVKCTGKYRPTDSPLAVSWYGRLNFEVKRKIDSQHLNILDTATLQKLATLQIGVVDDGSSSLELLGLLHTCSIADQTRVMLCGLQSIHEYKEVDGLCLKAHLKYQVASDLFKNKKTETMPCSLSFSNDVLLSDMWKKIKLLINSCSKLNEYVYNNLIWGEISLVNATLKDLKGLLKICVPYKTRLDISADLEPQRPVNDFQGCVEKAYLDFKLLFIEIFEDVRCFFHIGSLYLDQVRMSVLRKNVFMFLLCCIEDKGHIEAENIVHLCKYIYNELYSQVQLDPKNQLVMDTLKALYFLFSWFYVKKEPKPEEITNSFVMYLGKPCESRSLSQKDKYAIAVSKLGLSNKLQLPYLSLSELYRKDATVKLVWNASQLYSQGLVLEEDEVSSKKFYKHYFRQLKPCPFFQEIVNSCIPIAIIESVGGRVRDLTIDMVRNTFKLVDAPPPIPRVSTEGKAVIPANSNEWTVFVIEGPRRISQIIERFYYMEGVVVSRIKCGNHQLYNLAHAPRHPFLEMTLQECPVLNQVKDSSRDSYELVVEGTARNEKECEISRVKYLIGE